MLRKFRWARTAGPALDLRRGGRLVPAGNDTDSNHIPTMIYGSSVTPGSYSESINHYNVLKTVLSMYNLPLFGGAIPTSVAVISDVFQPANTATITSTSTLTPTATSTSS